jgi:hypothetical protein
MATFDDQVQDELVRHANNVTFLKAKLKSQLEEWNYLFGLWLNYPDNETALTIYLRISLLEKKMASNAARLENLLHK